MSDEIRTAVKSLEGIRDLIVGRPTMPFSTPTEQWPHLGYGKFVGGQLFPLPLSYSYSSSSSSSSCGSNQYKRPGDTKTRDPSQGNLQGQVESLRQSNTTLRSEAARNKRELQEVRRRFAEVKKELLGVTASLESARRQNLEKGGGSTQAKGTAKELAAAKESLRDARNQAAGKEKELAAMKQSLRDARNETSGREKELAATKQSLRDARNETSVKEKELAATKQSLKDARNQTSAKEKELVGAREASKELDAAKKELAGLKKELAVTKKQLLDVEKMVESNGGDQELSDLKKQLSQMRRDLVDKEKELAEAKEITEQLSVTRKQLEDMRKKLAEKEKEASEANEQLLAANNKVSELESRLSDREDELSDTEEQLSNTKKQLLEKEKQLSDKEKELQEAKTANEQNTENNSRLADLESRLSDMEDELSEAEEQLSNTKKQLSEKEKQLSDKDKELQEAKAANEELLATKGQLSEMKKQLSDKEKQLAEKEKELAEALKHQGPSRSTKNPTISTFNTKDVRPDTEAVGETNKEITFASTYPTPPSIAVALNSFNITDDETMFLSCFSSNLGTNGFEAHIDGALVNSASCSWLEIEPDHADFQCGRYSTLEDRPWNTFDGYYNRWISFSRPYAEPPNVVVWLTSFSIDRKQGWRIIVEATDITTTGFKISIEEAGDSELLGAGASWVAYPKDKKGVSSGTFTTEGGPKSGAEGEVVFPGNAFTSTPNIMVGFSCIDVEWKECLSLGLTNKDASAKGMKWNIKASKDTSIISAIGSYIAIA